MSNKNLLLALLAAWLFGSAWWQKSHIMSCASDPVASDSLAVSASVGDSLQLDGAAQLQTDTATLATDSLATIAAGTTEDDLAKNQKYESVFKPMNLYFHTNEANYIRTDENQKFLNEAKAYLAEHKDKSLQLTGHTDSDGADDANMRLSERRANDVKKQLTTKGFTAAQLLADAKGETQPVADNATPEGKKANRRVTIVVNQ
jgi:OmpA-OmpF porin, OOP family